MKWKKIIGFLCSVVFCTVVAVGMPQVARAADVVIDATTFPDAIFRSYVSRNFDTNKDGKLSAQEIVGVTEIYVSGMYMKKAYGKGIDNLTGVEYFTALTFLDCPWNQLTTLDVSKNTALIRLDCYNNQLTTLDVSKSTALTQLICYNNQLATLDVSNNTALIELGCYNNQLTTLDISNNTALTRLDCYNNQLTTLDVSKNTALKHLSCSVNKLTTLDVSKNTALEYLNCSVNQLTTLDVSNNTALEYLNCSDSWLTTLDVSKNTALKYLHCNNNSLTILNISKNTALKRLDCSYTPLTILDLSKNTALEYLNCSVNQLTTLDVNKNTALTSLGCSYNSLTTLDVSKNIALEYLDCYKNQLTALDVNKNTALTDLDCSSNQLTTLDVSNNTALKYLQCSGNNQLTTLDVSKNMALEYLKCYSSSLTTLTLHSQTYNTLSLYESHLHYSGSLSDLQNVTTNGSIIKVTDITKPATYKVNGKDFTIIYVGTPQTPSPSMPPIPPATHIFSDYKYTNLITYPETIYGNGMTSTVNGQKISNKVFTAYTDITASYKYTLNNKGVVIPSVGKVIVAVTKSAVKPTLDNRNRITDTSASKIATARIKNGQITVTAVGKEGGFVYLWVIDTGDKGVSACCLVNVKLAPTKLEVQDTSGNKLANTKLGNGKTLDVCVAGTVSNSTRTDDGTYTATVDTKYQNYVTVTPVQGSKNRFTITATGLNNNKNTKASVTFKCNENGKKISFPLTVTINVRKAHA